MQASAFRLPAGLRSTRSFFSSPRLWLLLILLLAWSLRLAHLGTMSLWWDETLSLDRSQRDLASILAGTIQIQQVVTRDLHPPLYFLLLHFSTLAFGITEFALRVLSTGSNVLTVALIFPVTTRLARLGRLRRPALTGVLAALLAALSPFYVWYAQEARPYALVLLWSLLALYALLRMTQEERAGRWTVLYLVALAATLATHYLSFVLLPFHAAALALLAPRERRTRLLVGVLLAGFGVILFLLPRGASQLTGTDAGGATFVPFFIILRDLLNSFAVGVTANLDTVAPLDLALLGLFLLGLAATLRPARRDWRVGLLLLGYFLLPAVALQVGSYLRPLYLNSRHLITASPPFYIGLALGVAALADRGLSAAHGAARPALIAAALAGLALFGAGSAFSLSNLYFNPSYAKDDHKGWSDFLRARARPGDIVILDAPQAETIYRYYGPRGIEWISLPNLGLDPAASEKADFKAVVDALRNHPRVWFLEIHRPVGDKVNHIYNLLARFGTWLNLTYFSGTSTQIVLHEIASDSPVLTRPPQIRTPLAVRFGDNLELAGYDAPASLPAGAHGAVKLYWRLLRPTGEDLAVSLRVVDDSGTRWAQWDSIPNGELMPMSKWPADQLVLEWHPAPLAPGAPPGHYHYEMSVYRPATGAVLPASRSDAAGETDTLRLGDLTVTRPDQPLDPHELVLDHRTPRALGPVELLGYDQDVEQAAPGATVPVTLYFRLLAGPGHDLNGRLRVVAPWWAIWNRAVETTPFTLSLADRLPGDIVQARASVTVPPTAANGDYSLTLSIDGASSLLEWWPGEDEIGSVRIESETRADK